MIDTEAKVDLCDSVINLDNGPQNSSHGTQFMKRMIEFADKNNLEIVLAY